MSRPFRCASGSEERRERLVGTASTVRAFLLVEVPGPWGVDAVRHNRLPEEVRSSLARRTAEAGVRTLLIRRHGRSDPGHTTLFAAYADTQAPWLERAWLDNPSQLLDIDLAALGSGSSPGLVRHRSPLFLVCTHGRHDVCCAERGRPVAAALENHLKPYTYEVSHIGGDRFAANMLVLPEGFYYGRVTPEAAVPVAEGHLAGHIDLHRFRGRSGYPFAVQAAETFLRRHLGYTRIDGLTLRSRARRGVDTTAVFGKGDTAWTVCVRTTRSEPTRLTCGTSEVSSGLVHELVSIGPDR